MYNFTLLIHSSRIIKVQWLGPKLVINMNPNGGPEVA